MFCTFDIELTEDWIIVDKHLSDTAQCAAEVLRCFFFPCAQIAQIRWIDFLANNLSVILPLTRRLDRKLVHISIFLLKFFFSLSQIPEAQRRDVN